MTKRLGISAVLATVALALAALGGASAASASSFHFDEYPATFKGAVVTQIAISFQGSSVTCGGGTFDGAATGDSGTLTPGATAISNCSRSVLGTKVPVTMNMNGCKLVFHAGSPASPRAGTFGIGPAGCGPIKMEEKNCTRLLAAQDGFSAAYDNVGAGNTAAVEIDASDAGFAFAVQEEGPGCTPGGASLSSQWRLTGFNQAGEQVGASIASDAVPLSINAGSFEAASYPVSLAGEQSEEHLLSFGGQLRGCSGVDFEGDLANASKAVTVGADYSACSFHILGSVLPANVHVNSCQYALNVTSSSPPYEGSLDVACANPGDKIEVRVYASKTKEEEGKTLCVVGIGAQKGVEGVGFSNLELGVAVDFALTDLAYTRTGSSLCGQASGTASYQGESHLWALP